MPLFKAWKDIFSNPAYNLQFCSVSQSCPTLSDSMNCSTPGLPVHHQLPEFTQTHIHQVSDAIQPSHPMLSPSPPAPNPSQHQSLFHESTLRIRWPKYWSFSFSITPSKEIPGLIFRMDWLDLLAIQGTLMSLLQHHSSKASILQCLAFCSSASVFLQSVPSRVFLISVIVLFNYVWLLFLLCPQWLH